MPQPHDRKPLPPGVGRILTGPEIEHHRRGAGLSVAELASLSDVPAAAIERIEAGGPFKVADNLSIKAVLAAWGQRPRFDLETATAYGDIKLRVSRRGIGSA